jgi:hypothetical protein
VLYEFGDKHMPCQVRDAGDDGVHRTGDEASVLLLLTPATSPNGGECKRTKCCRRVSIADANS